MTVSSSQLVRATAKMVWAGTAAIQNVFGFAYNGGVSITHAEARLDLATFLEEFYTLILTHLVDSMTFEEVEFFNVSSNGPMSSEPWPSLVTGADSSSENAPGVAGLIVLRTDLSHTVGRKYIGVMGEGSNDGGAPTSGTVTDLAAAGALLLEDFVGAETGEEWRPVILQPAGGSVTPRSVVVRANWAYQRRRTPGRGI